MIAPSHLVAAQQVIYYLLQSVVILGLLVRFVMYITFQKRLSIFGGILVRIISSLKF